MSESHPDNDRLTELLAQYAVQDLTSEERAELKMLLEQEDGVTTDEFEMAAAAMHLAMSETAPAGLPKDLADQIVLDANKYFDQPESVGDLKPAPEASGSRFSMREGIAWLTAAVALLLLLGNMFAHEPTIAEARASLLKLAGTTSVDWQALDDPTTNARTGGDVVWNTKAQSGYMRIRNLGINDPTAFQYQLWIFDPTQDDPIDGGVFDITGADQLVRIDPKLLVRDATQFAVTVEKPGGVPKSAKERIPLLAQIGR